MQLGDWVMDQVSGFEGTVTGICEYLDAGLRVQVQPQVFGDGKFADAQWFDQNRLVRMTAPNG